MSNQLTTQTAQVPSLKTFNQTITNAKTQEYLEQVLGDRKASFVSNLVALVSNSDKLQECESKTLMFSALQATALNLPLNSNLGLAYIIPYKNYKSGKTEAQFQIGYKGLIQLALRSGFYSKINTLAVREGELKSTNLLTGDMTIEAVENRLAKPVIGYAAYIELTYGYRHAFYMTTEEIEKFAMTYSETYKSKNPNVKNHSQWVVNFDGMARKTVLKQVFKFGLLSPEMEQALKYDQSVIRDEDGKPIYVDNNTIEDIQAEIIEEQGKEIINIEEETAQTVAPF